MEYNYDCDVNQGFSYNPSKDGIFGFVKSLKLGKIKLNTDTEAKDPKTEKNVKHAAIVERVLWDGDRTHPMHVQMRVNGKNRKEIVNALASGYADTNVEIDFSVWSRNVSDDKLYTVFHSGGKALKCFILVDNGDLAVHIETDPMPDVQTPQNHQLTLSLVPNQENLALIYQSSASDKVALDWGNKSSS